MAEWQQTKIHALETQLKFTKQYISELENELRETRAWTETLLQYGMPEHESVYGRIETWLEESRARIKLANERYTLAMEL